jgi:Na+/proline symporter
VGLIGGFFLTLATHGTDHDMVQRLLTTRDGRSGGRALLGSALLNFPLTALFLWIGTSIAFVYQTPPDYSIANSGQIFPLYALHELPMGLRGLIFAGILAAAMSSFDSAVCAVATTWTVDLLPTQDNPALALRRSRRVSMLCCGLLLASALAIAAYHESMIAASTVGGAPRFRLVDLALSAMTVLYGGLLGIFGLAVAARRRGSDTSVPIGLAVGAAVGLGLFLHPLLWGETLIAWPWWIPISASISFATAALGHRSVPSELSDLKA